MKKFFAVILAVIILESIASAKVYVAEPLLVPESPYSGMTFYVYRPYNMPKNWYITLDGYPVKKNPDGMWVYGTSEGPNLVATSYVVGSIIPETAGISKWVSDAQISSIRRLPGDEFIAVKQGAYTRSQMAGGQKNSTYIPDWAFRSDFMSIGNWKGTVDRIGVLDKPSVPIAWHSARPKIIYIWTGRSWYQIEKRPAESVASSIRREYTKIQKFVRDSGFQWYEQDMPYLAQQSRKWGYYWLGEISVTK